MKMVTHNSAENKLSYKTTAGCIYGFKKMLIFKISTLRRYMRVLIVIVFRTLIALPGRSPETSIQLRISFIKSDASKMEMY